MHSFKLVHRNEFGYIAICKDCGEFQMGMGNMLTRFDRKSLHDVSSAFYKINQTIKKSNNEIIHDDKSRSIICHTPHDDVKLAFYLKEFELVIELFEMARIEDEIYDLYSKMEPLN